MLKSKKRLCKILSKKPTTSLAQLRTKNKISHMKKIIATTLNEFLNENKSIGNDFIDKINNQWYENAAENHINACKKKYSKLKSKNDVKFDLNVNHDPSLEINAAEELLKRKLTSAEYNTLINKFNKAVVNKINLNDLRYYYT